MVIVRAVALVVIAAIAALVFELQNIWPFNQDRVLMLRGIFYASEIVAVCISLIPQHRIWGAGCLLIGFIAVTALSRATVTPLYVIVGLGCVGAILGLSMWRPSSS